MCIRDSAFLLFLACGKAPEITNTCITSCSTSVPGKINLAIEDHTDLEIKNFSMEVNGQRVNLPLLPKAEQGSYSCWLSFDEVELITMIQFDYGDNGIHTETVNYENLAPTREYSIDIQSNDEVDIRVQLVSSPDCVSSPN